MAEDTNETQELLKRAAAGDSLVFEELFQRHRPKLHRAIAGRIDPRIAGRLDASDVLQEAYMEAFKRLPKYLELKERMAFYSWLYWIARDKVEGLYRRHMGAQKRTARCEVPLMPVDSSAKFVSCLVGRLPTPSQELARAELAEQLRQALGQLDSGDRDLILWRHFEQLSAREMARLLNISEAAANKRYLRAVERLKEILQELGISKPGK